MTVDLDDGDPMTREQLNFLGVSPDTQLGYLVRFFLVGRSGTRLCRQLRDTATAGCALDSEKGSFLSTAGHLGAAPGEQLYFLKKTWLWWRRRMPAGRLEIATSPSAPTPTALLPTVWILR